VVEFSLGSAFSLTLLQEIAMKMVFAANDSICPDSSPGEVRHKLTVKHGQRTEKTKCQNVLVFRHKAESKRPTEVTDIFGKAGLRPPSLHVTQSNCWLSLRKEEDKF